MSDHTIHDQAPRSAGCDAFDASLADYLDAALDPGSRAAADAHLASCGRCAALLADLEAIADGARALPPLAPPGASVDAMWQGIASRIEAPVVPLGDARAARLAVPPAFGWRRLGAAAAALVLVTAGVTYEITKQSVAPDVRPVVAAAAPPGGAPAESVTRVAVSAPRAENLPAGAALAPAGARAGTRVAAGGRAALLSPAEATYEREITALRRILRERRGDLDPSTAVVLEQNLKVIDRAIAQSRAALTRDPRSRFLNEQLNSALDKKVELLRTAALLPART